MKGLESVTEAWYTLTDKMYETVLERLQTAIAGRYSDEYEDPKEPYTFKLEEEQDEGRDYEEEEEEEEEMDVCQLLDSYFNDQQTRNNAENSKEEEDAVSTWDSTKYIQSPEVLVWNPGPWAGSLGRWDETEDNNKKEGDGEIEDDIVLCV